MDTGNDEDAVTCCSPKRLKTSDESRDFFKDLPDSILLRILSFLPFIDAIRTVLLQRFGNLWHNIPVLDFNCCLYHKCQFREYDQYFSNEKFLGIIHQVLNLHKCGTLDKLCLHYGFSFTHLRGELDALNPSKRYLKKEKDMAEKEQIEKLIDYAISRNVKVLDLNFNGCIWVAPLKHYELPLLPDIFSSDYLTDLRLAACDISSFQKINLKSLRILFLSKVLLSDEVMEKILLCCSFLEDLSLVRCYGLSKLNCKNRNLKKVRLTLTDDMPLIISCPFLLLLEINGHVELADLLDVSSVVDATIDFDLSFKCKQKPNEDLRRLLLKLGQCNTFTICSCSILVLSIWNLTNAPCPSFGWKNLTLQLSLTKWHQLGLSLLLRSSLSVETLIMSIYPDYGLLFKIYEGQWIQAYDFDEYHYWDSQEATFPNLETIYIRNYVNQPYMIKMVKFLLKSATRLKVLAILADKDVDPPDNNLLKISQELLKLPRASPEAMLLFK